jgi:hypothetical protein
MSLMTLTVLAISRMIDNMVSCGSFAAVGLCSDSWNGVHCTVYVFVASKGARLKILTYNGIMGEGVVVMRLIWQVRMPVVLRPT